MGILDKIVQQMSIAARQRTSATELQLQYDVQVDVVLQLEDRVKQQLKAARSTAPQAVKLERDFDRVEARVRTLKLEAQRLEKQRKSTPAVDATSGFATMTLPAAEHGAADTYQQMQLQLENDVSLACSCVDFPAVACIC